MVKVTLLSFTNKPMKVIMHGFLNMHNKVPNELDELNFTEQEQQEFMEIMMKQPHQTVFEFVQTNWLIENVSRAFQTQLVRTRQASYSIQSLRIVDVGKFADEHKYTASSKIYESTKLTNLYEKAMANAQKSYRELIDAGAPVEDARGILPLNIHSPITMAINMRALYHMLELRFCENTAEEYKEVASQMKQEVAKKMGELFAKPMQPICFHLGKCPSPFPCDKYPAISKEKFPDIKKWLKG